MTTARAPRAERDFVPRFARPTDGSVVIWWLGQSGFAIRYRDDCVLIDPYLSDSLTAKYAGTDTPHVRMHPTGRRARGPARVPVTMVLSTHHHTDHLDPDTIGAHRRDCRRKADDWCRSSRRRRGARSRPSAPAWTRRRSSEWTKGTTIQIGAFEIVAIAAAHEAVEYDARGRRKCLGYILRSSAATIYHSGDTLLYDGLAARLRPYPVDVALLPINGKVGNMSGADGGARRAAPPASGSSCPATTTCSSSTRRTRRAEFIPECERTWAAIPRVEAWVSR